MLAELRSCLTYANIVSTICLFAVLGGGAYAASALPRNSVGAQQIKKDAVRGSEIKANAVTSSEVKDASLLARDFKAGELPAGATGAKGDKGEKGDQGNPGDPGAPGSPGSARAWARVSDTGAVSLSKGIETSNVDHAPSDPGLYCISGLPFTPQNIIATVETPGQVGEHIYTGSGNVPSSCPNGTQAHVLIANSANSQVAHAFYIMLN